MGAVRISCLSAAVRSCRVDADACILRRVLRSARTIAALLLAVFLSTVLTPSFAWEAATARGSHECHVDEVDATRDAVCGAGMDRLPGSDAHHHEGCAGHVLGHLVGNVGESVSFHLPDLEEGPPTAHLAASPRGFAERIDRPPRTLLL